MIKITNNINAIPVLHGRAAISDALREHLLDNKYDIIAIELPDYIQNQLIENIQELPIIKAVGIEKEDDMCFIPTDPCDAMIEAIRQSIQNNTEVVFTAPHIFPIEPTLAHLPDPWNISHIGLEKYYLSTMPYLLDLDLVNDEKYWIASSAQVLKELPSDKKILFLCRYHHLPIYQILLNQDKIEINYTPVPEIFQISNYEIDSDLLYFVFNELPFYVAEYEKSRQDPFLSHPDYTNLIKRLFQETRSEYTESKREARNVNLQRLQIVLQYLRNLCIQDNLLNPDLYTLVVAAKGVFGDSFATKIIDAAKYYPFFSFDDSNTKLRVGIEHVKLPFSDDIIEGFNFFSNPLRGFRDIRLKQAPDQNNQNHKYRFNSNGGFCSHIPEDTKIENFNKHVRKSALKQLNEFNKKSEKFTSSIKDGLDIRETLRNWHTKELYVKEIPIAQAKIDTVIILLDTNHDAKYPFLTTWYAEHEEESTLTFYSTQPEENIIGPGIARAYYGGFSLLYPPRLIPQIEYNLNSIGKSLHEILCEYSFKHSKEKVISIISPSKPGLKIQKIAQYYKKQIVWQPLSKFNQDTLDQIRVFHILENHGIRSIASRFIGF